jgi:hypothetical protein
MQLIVPYLFPPQGLLDAAADGLRLPALETLLARGTLSACPALGVEQALCTALGIGAVEHAVAPITLLADGGDPGAQYWLRADPVHLSVMRDRIVLADSSMLDLPQREAEELCADIARHFGAAFSPVAWHAQRWYLPFAAPPRLATTPLSIAAGRDIDPLLPSGDDALHYRSVLNELQMLLFEHPLNQAREARGELAVNSLWLWGGGLLPARPENALAVYGDDADVRALARFGAADVHARPGGFSADLLHERALIVLDQLRAGGQVGDAYGWREAIVGLERDWFAPLLAALRRGGRARLLDPVHGQALAVSRADVWKVWRRPHMLGAAST